MTGTAGAADGTGMERTFAALPPAAGRGFAQTWWGRTWLQALEDTALDGQQLRKGRAFARKGAVGAVSVRPGRVTAVVHGRDGTAYRADVLLRELDGDEWDRLLDVVVSEAGYIAALLDRDMPPHLAEDAAGTGVELLPGIGDLDAECTCEAWDHCVHTAALSYQVARLLDQVPFVLLLMRGRGERQLLDEIQLRSARAAEPEDADGSDDTSASAGERGVPAGEVFRLGALLPPLPGPPPPVARPGCAPALDGGTPPASGLDVAALEFLASDAAVRAHRMLSEALSPEHSGSVPAPPLTTWQDAVRLGAARPGAAVCARLAAACGRMPAQLQHAVRAWEYGGPGALAVLEDEWEPEPEALARARDQLAAAWADDDTRPRLRASRNRWTAVGRSVQLRYGPDGRWWPYRKERGAWWPAGGPERDPAAALSALLADGGADEES